MSYDIEGMKSELYLRVFSAVVTGMVMRVGVATDAEDIYERINAAADHANIATQVFNDRCGHE